MPKNAATARRYSGINILILWGSVIEKGLRGQNWLTFRQALTLGGYVRKGEKGTTVCYADRFIPKGELERAAKTGDDPNAVPILKRFTVFNVDQCDGLPASAFDGIAPLPDRDTIPHAESQIAATGADFRIGGARAFYQTAEEFIMVPPGAIKLRRVPQRKSCLPNSRSHKTELATTLQSSQSLSARLVVENAFCKNGMYTTEAWSSKEIATPAINHGFENITGKALASSERELKTLNNENSTSVVKAIVWAYTIAPVPTINPPGRV